MALVQTRVPPKQLYFGPWNKHLGNNFSHIFWLNHIEKAYNYSPKLIFYSKNILGGRGDMVEKTLFWTISFGPWTPLNIIFLKNDFYILKKHYFTKKQPLQII